MSDMDPFYTNSISCLWHKYPENMLSVFKTLSVLLMLVIAIGDV